jgi:hypothetical protein
MGPLFSFLALVLAACTTVTVRPLDPSLHIGYVCIEDNPKVTVEDFQRVLRDGFDRHGIASEVATGQRLDECEYILTYTALRSWDFTTYISHAELRLERAGRQIAYAEYHLKGKGGLSLNKWGDTREKIDPLIDELLEQYVFDPNAAPPVVPPRADASFQETEKVTPDDGTSAAEGRAPLDTYTELLKLDDLRQRGIITDEEFAEEKRQLLESN